MIDLAIAEPGHVTMSRSVGELRPGPGEVTVAINCLTLCGSDYALYEGAYGGPNRYPLRFGHEWSGTVIDADGPVRSWVGRSVTGDCSRWCGGCPRCAQDRNWCANIEKFGLTVDGFSTALRTVHTRYLYPDSFGLHPSTLAMTEFFSVVLHGLNRVGPIRTQQPALIVGGGALGSAAHVVLARMFGLTDIVIYEPDADKRATLLDALAGDVVVTEPPAVDVEASLKSYRTIGRAARYPLVIECSGTAAGADTALLNAAHGATVLLFSLSNQMRLRSQLIVTKGLRVQGSIGGTGAFEPIMRFFADHEDDVARLVTTRKPAEHAADIFADRAGRSRQIKAQLTF